MTEKKAEIVMNMTDDFSFQQTFANVEEERLHRKQSLVIACRLFGKFGFDEGVAGHITVRDPEDPGLFWVNAMGVSFKQMTMSHLIQVNHDGEVVQGNGLLNGAAFTIHANIHKKHPRVTAACHAHSVYGKAWSSLGKKLDPITQDACAFWNDHVLFDDFTGVVLDGGDGAAIAEALGDNKAAILQNHGLLTTGSSVEEAAWWFITMERSCQAQLLAEAAGTPKLIREEICESTYASVGSELAGWFNFQPLRSVMLAEQPELLD